MCINHCKRLLVGVFLVAGSLFTIEAGAQNVIADIGKPSFTEKMVFAVYDIRPKDVSTEKIQEIALSGIKTYASKTEVRNGIPSSPYPAQPAKMTIRGQRSTCEGEVFTIVGLDASMAKYGEMTVHKACLFPYEGGYRLNYFAVFGQQSGAGSSNPNVLAAMLGRVFTNATGLGDSSKFISKILDRVENGFREQNISFKLVEFHPANLEGRVATPEDPTATSQSVATQSAPASPTAAASPQPVLVSSTSSGAPAVAASGVSGSTQGNSQLVARRDLRSMGLEYFNQEQFFDAVKRGDKLAVELFLAGGGIDPNKADKSGKTPIKAATAFPEIKTLLLNAGAKAN